MDRGHKYTDKRIALLEKQLDRHYKRASAKAKKQLKTFLKEHEAELKDLWESGGDIDTYVYKNMNDEIDRLADLYVKADREAATIVNSNLDAIFAYNYNDTAERIRKKTGIQIPLMKNVT